VTEATEEVIDKDALRETLRRANTSVSFARTNLQRAREIEAMVSRGIAVVAEERQNVPALEKILADAEARSAVLRASLDEVIAREAAEAAAAEAAEANQRALAIAAADKRLLLARREQDRLLVARLDCAQGKATDAEHARAVDTHVAAVEAVRVALVQREALEVDHE